MEFLVIAPIHHFFSHIRDPLPQKISLENNYFIKKLSQSQIEKIISKAKEFGSVLFTEVEMRKLKQCQYGIFYSYSNRDGNPEIPEEVVRNMYRIVNTLRIVKPTRAAASVFNFRVQGKKRNLVKIILEPLPIFLVDRAEPGRQHFDKKDAYKIRLYWKKVLFLYTRFFGTYHKVLNSIIFFEIAHQMYFYKSRIISFVIALESLFNTSDKEVSLTLKQRGAWFLGGTASEREEISNKLKEVYDLRSKFIHGQATPPKLLKDEEKQQQIITNAEDLTRKAIQKIFDYNLVSYFDKPKNIDREFNKLILGGKSPLGISPRL